MSAKNSIGNWLLILGAGGSIGSPKSLPTFEGLSKGVMLSLGWKPGTVTGPDKRMRTRWSRDSVGAFDQPGDMASEVLFGTLTSARVEFARDIADVLSRGRPNVAHRVAAAVLQAGGLVWTTNVDCGVEQACGTMPPRVGRASQLAEDLLGSILAADSGTLVKFHGTVEDPKTFAFTDRELLEPLGSEEVEHLTKLARGRTVVIYGYAGADADLFELLERTFAVASKVVWFEPTRQQQDTITASFPASALNLKPKLPDDQDASDYVGNATLFVEFARGCGVNLDDEFVRKFVDSPVPPVPTLPKKDPPAITYARLIARFGAAGDELEALRAARAEDLCHRWRLRTGSAYAKWEFSLSLYGTTGRPPGAVRTLHRWLASHRWVLAGIQPPRLRNRLITRACAVLLQDNQPKQLEEFADWAAQRRAGSALASDLYYRAQGRRYQLRIADALDDAVAARAGLSAGRDPERHAGAVLEEGILAIYQGRFSDALRCAFELRRRTGRYAIPRWRAWGAWLEAVACCYQRKPGAARDALKYARRQFTAEQRPGPMADVRTVELLIVRVELALGQASAPPERSTDDAEALKGRYLDDRLLVLADLALAEGDKATARWLIGCVRAQPSCPVSRAWSEFGAAELMRENDAHAAAARFRAIGAEARQLGASWLQVQTHVAIQLCGETDDIAIPEYLRHEIAERGFGHPRVLWMMTT